MERNAIADVLKITQTHVEFRIMSLRNKWPDQEWYVPKTLIRKHDLSRMRPGTRTYIAFDIPRDIRAFLL